jgi:hypothetical protein
MGATRITSASGSKRARGPVPSRSWATYQQVGTDVGAKSPSSPSRSAAINRMGAPWCDRPETAASTSTFESKRTVPEERPVEGKAR